MQRVTAHDRDETEVSDGVYLADLAAGENICMKYWEVGPGETLPMHRHEHEQIGFVISGRLVALVEGKEYALGPGDSYLFPGNELHGAENRWDEPAIGIGVLSPPRSEPDWGDSASVRNRASTETDD